MRATTLLNRVLGVPGIRVVDIDVDQLANGGPLVATVALKARRRLSCPHCPFTTTSGYDTRWAESSWRHLDASGRPLMLTMLRRRLICPQHGVVVQGVPFARAASRFTRGLRGLHRLAGHPGRKDHCSDLRQDRLAHRGGDLPTRSGRPARPGTLRWARGHRVDEISWRKHHRYLTLVSDPGTSKIVWGAPGKNAATLDGFFDEIGPANTSSIEAVSMDMGPAFAKSVRTNAPQASICIDPFHVVQLATTALDTVRRQIWQQARNLPDQSFAKKYKGSRYVLLKNPGNLTKKQEATLAAMRQDGGARWYAYELKESLRGIFAGDLDPQEVKASGAKQPLPRSSPLSKRPQKPSASTPRGSVPP